MVMVFAKGMMTVLWVDEKLLMKKILNGFAQARLHHVNKKKVHLRPHTSSMLAKGEASADGLSHLLHQIMIQ